MFKNIKTAANLAAETLAAENAAKVQEAKTYLTSTDWVVVKINEVAVTGGDVTPLLTQYATELAEREAKRTLLNELEA